MGNAMQQNVGNEDRIIRAILGVILIGWGIFAQSWWAVIGIIPLFSAVVSWCPAYVPFGINTQKKT